MPAPRRNSLKPPRIRIQRRSRLLRPAAAAALAETLVDDFEDGTLDSAKWGGIQGTPTETGGRLLLDPADERVESAGLFNWVGSSGFIDVRVVPTVGGACYFGVIDAAGAVITYFEYLPAAGTLGFLGGTPGTVAYNTTSMRYWRHRESAGTWFFDTSPDGTTWTNRSTATTFAGVGSARYRLLNASGGTGTYELEGVNFVTAAGGASGAALGPQRTNGAAVTLKQATAVAVGQQRSNGTATASKQTVGASQGSQRTSGVSVGAKQIPTAATQGAQRTSGTAAIRKQITAVDVGPQHTAGVAATRKQAIVSAAGPQRTAGLVVRGAAAPNGPAVGSTRVAGISAGVKATGTQPAQGPQRVQAISCLPLFPGQFPDTFPCVPAGLKATVGAAQGRQRTSGVAARVPGGPHVGPQRSSGQVVGKRGVVAASSSAARTAGQNAAVKQATAATVGQQHTAGVAAKIPTGPARATMRTAGQSAGIRGAVVASVGPTRASGQAAGVHAGITVAQGSQRTASTSAAKHGGTTSAAGQSRASGTTAGSHRTGPIVHVGSQRTAGLAAVAKGGRGTATGAQRVSGTSQFTTVPPPRWVEGDTSGSGLVEGATIGSGQVEGVLVGAGIVEGSSSL